ncbi:MAG: zinc-dependent alcohol dehydrogenase family protein [Clostridia bacterium]
MKGAVFEGKNIMNIKEIPMPEPGHGDVLVQVKACGICGTDLHIYKGAEGAAPTPPGTVLGHEFSGLVEKTGEGVVSVMPGDRVSVNPNESCEHCMACKQGRAHFCENRIGYGTTVHGGFAQYCLVKEKQLHKIPDHVDYMEAAMGEPVACCLHGMERSGIRTGSRVLILGAGTIGLIMLQLARLMGALQVAVTDPVEAKRAKAMKLGADLCIDPHKENVGQILEENGFHPIDSVIECVGQPATMEQAIGYVGTGGTVLLFGLAAPQDMIPLRPFDLFKKEITITSSFINPYTQEKALELIASGQVNVRELIVGTVPLKDMEKAMQDHSLLSQGKIMVTPD